jgi:hypothetical protein
LIDGNWMSSGRVISYTSREL